METADVAVVGGGIIGCSVTRELARSGADVVLLERYGIASAASGRNHGLLMYPQNPTPAPLYRRSMDLYRELIAESPVQVSLDTEPRGFLIVVEEEGQWPAAEREARASEEGGIEVGKVDPDELRSLEPGLTESLHGAWRMDDGYRVDPAALTLATALSAREDGADIRTYTEVKQIQVGDGKVAALATDSGVIEAPVVVDAAGPWAPKLARQLGVDIPVVGVRGWLLAVQTEQPVAHHLIESPGWHLMSGEAGPPPVTLDVYGAGEHPPPPDRGVLIQQNLGGNVLVGGSRRSSIRDDPEDPEVTKEIASDASRLMPALSNQRLVGAWSGVRPMSPDGLPIVGWVKDLPGLFVAGGHGGQGVILGGGTGELVAQMITGDELEVDPEPFSPERF